MYLWFYKTFVFYGYIVAASSLSWDYENIVFILGISEFTATLISGILPFYINLSILAPVKL